MVFLRDVVLVEVEEGEGAKTEVGKSLVGVGVGRAQLGNRQGKVR